MTDVKRSYSAPRRAEAADQTRRAVLDAARALFTRQGYAATTIDQIARQAEVSRPTVFAVGSKAALLKLTRDIAMAGDDTPVAVADRAGFRQVMDEADPRKSLQRFAAHVGAINSRYADLDEVLHRAAGSDAELAQLWQTSEEQRRRGAELMMHSLHNKGRLALPRERAIDVLAMMMAPGLYQQLVLTRGWSHRQYVSWLGDTLPQLLLA